MASLRISICNPIGPITVINAWSMPGVAPGDQPEP